jgi:hypothetical protein
MTIQHKKSKQNKSNLKLTALILAGLILTSCSREEPDRTTIQGKAKYDVSLIKHEVHAAYLNCYPLAPAQKKACTEKIADQYLKPRFENEYKTYKETFQQQSEKLGFKYFLNGKGLTCDSVSHSPTFDDREDAYLVVCSAKHKYYLQFDYDNKQWNLKAGA